MIRNYFKIAFRNMWKNKSSTFINLTGLTVGLTCCLLMTLYLQHELSYDKFQQNGDRIVRLIMEYSHNDGELTKGNFTSTKVLPTFKQTFPEVVDGIRITDADALVKVGEETYNEPNFFYADSNFFQVFSSFKLISGNAKQVLKAANMIVLTKSTAKRYFGKADPVGKTIMLGSKQIIFTVTGVSEDCPSNSQIKYDMITSFSSLGDTHNDNYWNANYTTFLLLKDKADLKPLQAKITAFMKKETASEAGVYINFILEPFLSIHLHSPYDGFEPNSNVTYIYITGGIALLILIIACFTYVNLATARSLERAREVGIRKVSGAHKSQVFWQFISESTIITLVATVLSFVCAALLLPAFNQLADRSLLKEGLFNFSVIATSICIIIIIAMMAGSYPAMILSRFQPVKVLKGSFRNTSSGSWLRRSLIVFQFSISAFLLIATIILQRQLSYIQNKKLGYEKDHVIVMRIDQKIIDKIDLVKSEFKMNPDILGISKINQLPVNIYGGYFMAKSKDMASGMSVKANPVDEDFIKVAGMRIVAGSDLTHQDALDANREDYTANYYHYIINTSAAKALGWTPEQAIGKTLYLGDQRPGEIKAVIEDFNFASLHTPVQPLVLFPGGWGNNLLVKTSGHNIATTLGFLEKKWKTLAPHRPFEFRFLDEDYNKLYSSEIRTGKVFTLFSTIAILLACLGLFGLSAYSVQQRQKEIGIRKVLGASVSGITLLLANQFIRLVLVAFIVAAPLAWFAANQWLQDFAYRVNIPLWIFIITGIVLLLISLLTISVQAIKAALTNPIKSLRTD